jgi:hypothetical protein
MRTLASVALYALLLAACVGTPEPVLRTGLPDTGGPAPHAVHDRRLRQWMAEMNALMFERMRTELELDRERRRQAERIAGTAADLERTIGRIIDTLPRLALSPNERTTFLALADTLRSQVQTLKVQAQRNYIDALPDTLEHIQATCTACHRLFRKADR